MTSFLSTLGAAAIAAALVPSCAFAQATPPLSTCAEQDVPACDAVPGDRAEGWGGQSRAEVMAPHAMVTTSQPLAAQAGLQIMQRGGNAIDAAVASAAVLNVVEPMNTGIGGDLFAIIYVAKEKKLHMLNASGMAPSGATLAHYNGLGYRAEPRNWGPGSGMPGGGILTVTVPGAAWGWEEALTRFGKLGFKEVLQPAIDYADNGFPVSQRIALEWQLPGALPLRNCCTSLDPDSVAAWYINGEPPVAGQIYRNRDLAKSFRLLQEQGRDAFYKGEIARAIVAKSTALGGTMTLEDLASYRGQWVEPAATGYHGYTLNELPPPSQAWAANLMLNILRGLRAPMGERRKPGAARTAQPEILAFSGRGQEARLCGSLPLQRRSRFRAGAARSAALERICSVAVPQGRSRPRLADRAAGERQCQRRHHRALDR